MRQGRAFTIVGLIPAAIAAAVLLSAPAAGQTGTKSQGDQTRGTQSPPPSGQGTKGKTAPPGTGTTGGAKKPGPRVDPDDVKPADSDGTAIRKIRKEQRKYQERLAKIRRLRELAKKQGNAKRLAAIDKLEAKTRANHEKKIAKWRKRLGTDRFDRIDGQAKKRDKTKDKAKKDKSKGKGDAEGQGKDKRDSAGNAKGEARGKGDFSDGGRRTTGAGSGRPGVGTTPGKATPGKASPGSAAPGKASPGKAAPGKAGKKDADKKKGRGKGAPGRWIVRPSKGAMTSLGLIGGVALALTGCEQKNDATVDPAVGEEVVIPTEAEADAAAAAEISEANADEVFDELSREIEAEEDDTGGG